MSDCTPPTASKGGTVPGRSPWGGKAGWLTTSDGAAIWYSDTGQGLPLLLVHGWTGSSRIWSRTVPELSRSFRVITMDLRGHGQSSKILHGHTVGRYAEDIHEVTAMLKLESFAMAVWSMAGSVGMEYWLRHGGEGRLKALAFVDVSVAPFKNEPWNSHRMKQEQSEAMLASFEKHWRDPDAFMAAYIKNTYLEGNIGEDDVRWMLDEKRKVPSIIATAIFSDYLVRDYEQYLPQVTIPTAVFAGVSGSPASLDMGRHFADKLPRSEFHAYPDAGHLLFFERPERFNAEMTAFVTSLDT